MEYHSRSGRVPHGVCAPRRRRPFAKVTGIIDAGEANLAARAGEGVT